MRPGKHAALIVVDIQNGFTPGGNLAVADADCIIPTVNRIMTVFDNIVLTQDWHPASHISFASNHSGKNPYDVIELPYGPQVLWPAHCVQGSRDAEFHPDLNTSAAQLIIRKGFHSDIDSYSAFVEADRTTQTGLAGYLRERGIDTVYVAGIATDFCVAWTALDAVAAGFDCFLVDDACMAIDFNGSLQQAYRQMEEAGVRRLLSERILG